MTNSRVSSIKHAQKESLLMREISNLLIRISQDEPKLLELYVTRVKLSPDKGTCTVFLHCPQGLSQYEEKRPTLVLYKPSIRQALSKLLHGRYTPKITFMYDAELDKQRHIDDLIESLKKEGKL